MPIPVYAAPPPPPPPQPPQPQPHAAAPVGHVPQPPQSVFQADQSAMRPGYAAPGYAGHGDTGQGYAGQGYAGQGYASQGYPGQGYASQGYPGQGYSGPQVAFDPVATQYSYSDVGGVGGGGGPVVPAGAGYSYAPVAPPAAAAAAPPAGVYHYGAQAYVPVGPAQQLPYQDTRAFFVPAAADGGRSARLYYPPGAPMPVAAPGPPPLPVMVGPPSSPGPYPTSMTPIATGTPVRGGHAVPVNFDGSFAAFPPSPIREYRGLWVGLGLCCVGVVLLNECACVCVCSWWLFVFVCVCTCMQMSDV